MSERSSCSDADCDRRLPSLFLARAWVAAIQLPPVRWNTANKRPSSLARRSSRRAIHTGWHKNCHQRRNGFEACARPGPVPPASCCPPRSGPTAVPRPVRRRRAFRAGNRRPRSLAAPEKSARTCSSVTPSNCGISNFLKVVRDMSRVPTGTSAKARESRMRIEAASVIVCSAEPNFLTLKIETNQRTWAGCWSLSSCSGWRTAPRPRTTRRSGWCASIPRPPLAVGEMLPHTQQEDTEAYACFVTGPSGPERDRSAIGEALCHEGNALPVGRPGWSQPEPGRLRDIPREIALRAGLVADTRQAVLQPSRNARSLTS